MRARFFPSLALLVSLLAQPALSQPKPPAGKPPGKPATVPVPTAPAIDAKALLEKIKSGEPPRVAEGLAAAQAGGGAAAAVAPAIEELLKKGTTLALAKSGLAALGAIGAVSSSAVIRPYLRHRNADLRRAAVLALSNTKGAEAHAAYREGLRNEDATVRGASAMGLGNLGATDALGDLFLALDRNVPEAAAAIGRLCAPADCDKLVGKLGQVPFVVLSTGFDAILFRQKPLPEDLLLRIVERVRQLKTAEAAKYLSDVASRWPAAGSRRVKQALDGEVASTTGAAK